MKVIDFIFPKKCLECGKEGKYICKTCIQKVPPGGWTNLGETKVYSIWRYKGVVRKAIIALKYKFATDVAKELIGYINLPLSKQTLVSVPSHWYKQNLRGFNQTELLGKRLASKMGWKYLPKLITKRKSTPEQVGLKKSARLKNIKGAFVINPEMKVFPSVLLFDDVLTTGSTLKETIRILREAGIKNVWCLTVAK